MFIFNGMYSYIYNKDIGRCVYMKDIVVCAIAKNEHRYINDFVKWYIAIGFDKIYLYDNDSSDKPYIGDFISDKYKDKVVIIDIRDISGKQLQQRVYTDFYDKYNKVFEWCLFIDIDEYLIGVHNIKVFLDNAIYSKYNQIRIRWRLFGDDNLIYRNNSDPIWYSLHRQVNKSLHRNLKEKGDLEIQGKAIVRGGLGHLNIDSPHFVRGLSSCLPSGRHCFKSGVRIRDDYTGEKVFINHYMTKTLSEFVEQKLGRNDCVFNTKLTMAYYWRINEKTIDKINWLKERGIEYE